MFYFAKIGRCRCPLILAGCHIVTVFIILLSDKHPNKSGQCWLVPCVRSVLPITLWWSFTTSIYWYFLYWMWYGNIINCALLYVIVCILCRWDIVYYSVQKMLSSWSAFASLACSAVVVLPKYLSGDVSLPHKNGQPEISIKYTILI